MALPFASFYSKFHLLSPYLSAAKQASEIYPISIFQIEHQLRSVTILLAKYTQGFRFHSKFYFHPKSHGNTKTNWINNVLFSFGGSITCCRRWWRRLRAVACPPPHCPHSDSKGSCAPPIHVSVGISRLLPMRIYLIGGEHARLHPLNVDDAADLQKEMR